MKILCYRNHNDYNFESMISILSKTKYKVGYLSGEINKEAILEFSPDIIIHNIPEAESFPIKNNAISININESTSVNSFSLNDKESENYIQPFVTPRNTTINSNELPKYQSDAVYIGSPFIFHKRLVSFLCSSDTIRFKFFDHNPTNINGYCGICNPADYFKFYKHSKASLVDKNDLKRLMDIIISDGNPIICDNNPDKEIDMIERACNNNEKYKLENYSKQDIINNHTVFDRLSEIFSKVGLLQISKEMKKYKADWIKI